MKFKTNTGYDTDTCYQGQMQCSYDLLARVFGEAESGDGEKTTAEWRIKFEDGTVATIYDYYTFSAPHPLPNPEHNLNWHIGGVDDRAVQLVEQAIFKYQLDNFEE